MKGKPITYSDAELFWIYDNHRRPRAEAHAEFVYLWDRPDVSLANFNSLCKRKGWLTGRTGVFEKGQTPANKGKKMPYNENSARHRFKPGERRGRANALYKPIGTERVTRDGYLERKIHDGMPLQSRWLAVHLVRWEELNGPLPEGYCLKCLDGDKSNTDPANWKAMPRAMLARLAGRFGRDYDGAPAELKPTIMLTAELEQRVTDIRKDRS